MYASMNEEIEARHIVVRALERMEKDDPQGVSYIRRHLLALDEQLASTLKAAQGGVTEAFNWTEFWNRVSQSFSSKDVDEVYACYEAGKRAALSAEPAAQPEQEGPGEEDGPWAEGWAQRSGQAEPAAQGDVDFKNFHRLLCERFGYVHDPVDWKRDQLSLIEHIAHTAPPAQPADSKVIGDDSKVKPADRVPEGWVLVPRKPTEVMAVAATKALVKFKPETVYGHPVMVTAREVYAAMLTATPAAPAEEGDGKEGVR